MTIKNGELRSVLGIDPGLKGALVLLKIDGKSMDIFDMPTFTLTSNKKKKGQIDLYRLARWLDDVAPEVTLAVIENPHAMPGQGVSSSFNFGFSCGVIQAAVAAYFIPIHLVAPATWKKIMKVSKDKDSSRHRASMLYPKFSHNWPLVKHDGRAEAMLLASYARQLENSGNREELTLIKTRNYQLDSSLIY